MNKNILTLLLAIIFMAVAPSNIFGQTKHHELGLRFNDFKNFDFIYKTGKDANHLYRYRLLVSSLNYQKSSDMDTYSFYVGGTVGKEKRKNINDKFQFLHGFEFKLLSNFSHRDNSSMTNFDVSLGYVLGFQYNISSYFGIHLETIPNLSSTFRFVDGKFAKDYNLGLGFNSEVVALGVVYRFVTSPKEE